MRKNFLYSIIALLCMMMSAVMAHADDYTTWLTTERGFTEVTTVDGLKSGASYYYILTSAENTGLIVGVGRYEGKPDWANETSKALRYVSAATDPVLDKTNFFTIEYNSTYIGLRNAVYSADLFQTHDNAGYMYVNTYTDKNLDEWSYLIPTRVSNYFLFESGKYPMSSENWACGYLGPWNNSIASGEPMALNRKNTTDDEAGHYRVFRISIEDYNNLFLKCFNNATASQPVDVSNYVLVNPSFETGDMTGWTYVCSNDDGGQTNASSNGDLLTSMDGGYTCNFQWWAWTFSWNENSISQTTATLPAGKYTFSVIGDADTQFDLKLEIGTSSQIKTGLGAYVGQVFTQDLDLPSASNLTLKLSTYRNTEPGWTPVAFRVDDFKFICKGVYISGITTALPNNTTTVLQPGKLYYYDINDGNYLLNGKLDNMVFAQNNSAQFVGDLTFQQAQPDLSFTAGRVYFMTTDTDATLQLITLKADDRWVWKGETITANEQKWYLYNVQYGINNKQGFLSRNTSHLFADPNESGVYPFKFSGTSSTTVSSDDTYHWTLTRSGSMINYKYTAAIATSGTGTTFSVSSQTVNNIGTVYHFSYRWTGIGVGTTRYFGAESTSALAAQSSSSNSNAWALISTEQALMYNRYVAAYNKASLYAINLFSLNLPINETEKNELLTLLAKTGVYWNDGSSGTPNCTTKQIEDLNAKIEEWFDDSIASLATTQTISSLPEGFYKVKGKVKSANKQTVTLQMGSTTQRIPMTGSDKVTVELPLHYHNVNGSVNISASCGGSPTFSDLELIRYDYYYDETITSAEYATTALRYNALIPEDEDMKILYVTRQENFDQNVGGASGSIHLGTYEGTLLPANEGVILYKGGLTSSEQFRFYRTKESVVRISGNQLIGAPKRIEASAKDGNKNYYMLAKKTLTTGGDPVVGFFQLDDNVAIKAHKAYLTTDKSSSSAIKGYLFSFDEEEEETPTAIEQMEKECEATVVGIYSLGGARQSQLQRGMNIVRMSDGSVKKILVK